MPASLYLVATPIGNLEDITLRALRILREEVAVIACEDTRQTQKLLDHFEIRTPVISYYEHNEAARSVELVERMAAGLSVALVSDAGTPLVSDPGYRLVTAAIQAGFRVIPIPGACAAVAAVSAAGLPTDEFRFAGFLPPKSGARRRFLEELRFDKGSVVVYDSPHRVLETLEDISAVLGDRRIALARELTKIHEEILRGTALDVLKVLQARAVVKGEITLVISRAEDVPAAGDPITEVARLQAAGIERMEAIKAVAKQFGLGKRELYKLIETAPKHKGS